jgi:hypothetical protein
MDHAVKFGHLAVTVGEHRKVGGVTLRLLDVAVPPHMGFDGIDRQADHLHVAFLPLRLQPCDFPQFGRTNRREVLGVAEKNAPAVPQPFVERERPMRALLFEVGCDLTKLK